MRIFYDFRTLSLAELSNHIITVTSPLSGGGLLSSNSIAIGINQATAGTAGFLTASDFNTFTNKMTNPMSQLGDLIYGGTAGAPTRLGIGVAGTVLKGGATPSWGTLTEENLLGFSNNTTANTSTAQHGLCPRLDNNASHYLDGQGNWSSPPAGTTTIIGSTTKSVKAIATSTYTITPADDIIQMTVSGTLTMPPADNHVGKEIIIDNAYTSQIALLPSGAQTIQGESSQTIPSNCSLSCYSDNSKWRIY